MLGGLLRLEVGGVAASRQLVGSLVAGVRQLAVTAPDPRLPRAPKRPNNPWVTYFVESKGRNPALGMKDLSQDYRRLPQEQKQHMEEAYREAREVYRQEMEAVPEETRQQILADKRARRHAKELKAALFDLKTLYRSVGRPKRPPTAWSLYCMEQGRMGRRLFAGMATEWAAMSEVEKEPYVLQNARMKAAYPNTMREWEARMEEQGRVEELATLEARVARLRKEGRAGFEVAVATPQVPKKPNTPWLNFYMANLPKYKKSHPEVKTTQLKKLISEEWKGVPEDTKAPMVALYEKERAKYQQEMDRLPVDVVENIKERRSATRAMKASSRVDELAALEAKLVGLGRQGRAGLDGSLRKR